MFCKNNQNDDDDHNNTNTTANNNSIYRWLYNVAMPGVYWEHARPMSRHPVQPVLIT